MAQKTNGIENRIGDYSKYVVVATGGENVVYADLYESEAREKKVGFTTFNLARLKELYNTGIGKLSEFKELERILKEADKVIKQNKIKKVF